MKDVQAALQELRATREDPFHVTYWSVATVCMGDSDPQNEAVVKVTYGQTEGHEAGDGVGPIDALNLALLKAIAKQFPSIAEIKLYDYHIDLEKKEENRSPGGMVHCTVKFYYGTERWVSTASDKNQNTAGWKAILDAYILVAMQGQ